MHGEATREGAACTVLGWGKFCTAPALEALGEHKLWMFASALRNHRQDTTALQSFLSLFRAG